MNPQLSETEKRPSASKPARALQEELVAAIHGAFEVAVEIAVQEVTKLVGQATADIYEEMQRENESLKQRLQKAEATLDSARVEDRGRSPPLHTQPSTYTGQPKCDQRGSDPQVGKGVDRGHSRVEQSPEPQHKHMSRDEERRSGGAVKTQHVRDAASDPQRSNARVTACDTLNIDVSEVKSLACVVRLENLNHLLQDAPPLPCGDDETPMEQVTVKQEKPEEENGGAACCLDSIKVEEFSPDCMLAVQSKLLEEWKPEELDIQSQDSVTPLSHTGLAQVHPSNLTTNVSPPTDLPSLSSEFPNIFQLAEPAHVPEASPQVYGVHIRTSRNLSHTYACKYCGQTFHLPSLLRRHCGQCEQKLQQSCQQPVVGNRRTRLQLYPPGCSPFRCTVCNREFNRMENLKTHLRIHTGERPYTCSVCSKCFRHSGALTRHFRIHTGEKPYICGQCGKSFRNCGGLKFHQRSHSKQLQ